MAWYIFLFSSSFSCFEGDECVEVDIHLYVSSEGDSERERERERENYWHIIHNASYEFPYILYSNNNFITHTHFPNINIALKYKKEYIIREEECETWKLSYNTNIVFGSQKGVVMGIEGGWIILYVTI
jgi:hypothetical protein